MNFFYTHDAPEYRRYMHREGELVPAHQTWHEANNTYGFAYGLGAVIVIYGLLLCLHPWRPSLRDKQRRLPSWRWAGAQAGPITVDPSPVGVDSDAAPLHDVNLTALSRVGSRPGGALFISAGTSPRNTGLTTTHS